MKQITLLATALFFINGCAGSTITPETDSLFTQKEWKAVNKNEKVKKEIFYAK